MGILSQPDGSLFLRVALLNNVKGNGAALFGDELILGGLDAPQYQLFNAQDAGKRNGKHGVSGHEMQL